MQKVRNILSDIISDLKANNLDDRLSYRYLYNKVTDKAEVFLKQDADYRKIFRMNNLWKTINCVDLEDVDIITCPWFLKDCKTIKKSKVKIPDSYETSYGNTLVVTTLNNSKVLKQIKPNQYEDYASNRFSKGWVFWIEDGYLYIPDTSISYIKVRGLFKDTTEVDKINGIVQCISPLDSEFSFPDYIISIAKTEVLKELLTSKGISQDENPNLNQNIR